MSCHGMYFFKFTYSVIEIDGGGSNIKIVVNVDHYDFCVSLSITFFS